MGMIGVCGFSFAFPATEMCESDKIPWKYDFNQIPQHAVKKKFKNLFAEVMLANFVMSIL